MQQTYRRHPCRSAISIKLLCNFGVLLYIFCIISEHLFLKTLLKGCFWTLWELVQKSEEIKICMTSTFIIFLCQCCPHIETSQLIFSTDQLTCFYMRAKLALNGLMSDASDALHKITVPWCSDYHYCIYIIQKYGKCLPEAYS